MPFWGVSEKGLPRSFVTSKARDEYIAGNPGRRKITRKERYKIRNMENKMGGYKRSDYGTTRGKE